MATEAWTDQVASFRVTTSMESLLTHIVRERLKVKDVDVTPWVDKLTSNLVFTLRQLRRLSPQGLKSLKLPLPIEEYLLPILTPHKRPLLCAKRLENLGFTNPLQLDQDRLSAMGVSAADRQALHSTLSAIAELPALESLASIRSK
mmetsp:Transcript_25617/g.28502  ORF Transcript_25617/g.28502 Transcript_25617/m.28502 type:complete len:146 (-) Transcript_25617:153-590(-)